MGMQNPFTFLSIETTAFSGATLLAFLLSSHPDIATIGEISGLIATDDPETYLCSCGTRIKECKFWDAVKSGMHAKGQPFEIDAFDLGFNFGGSYLRQRLRDGSLRNKYLNQLYDKVLFNLPGERQHFARAVERNVAFIKTVLEVTGNRIFLDSSKSRLRVRALQHFKTMDIRVIHLTRRVEGVNYSHLKRNPDLDERKLAHDWKQRHRRLLSSYQPWGSSRYIHVRYEDICRETEKEIVRLYKFLGVRDQYKALNFQHSDQHVIGNPMRLQPLSEITLDESWQHSLNPTQLANIQRVAGVLNQQFGYL